MMHSERQANAYCSELSALAGEALYGSATRTGVYFLLEYNGNWEAQAFPASRAPQAVKAHLEKALEELPQAKLLLIKNRTSLPAAGIRFYTALAREHSPALYRFHFANYAGLLDIDLALLAAGEPEYQGHLVSEPLGLVCTNGRRDLCCAKFGLPVYAALHERAGEAAWECTHVGGHRFAANLLCLPHGLLYGRVTPAAAAEVWEGYLNGQVYLDGYRGRSVYPPAAQAGEYFLRRETGELGVEAYRLVAAGEAGEGVWQLRFEAAGSGGVHELVVGVEKTGEAIFESCQMDKSSSMKRYVLREHHVR